MQETANKYLTAYIQGVDATGRAITGVTVRADNTSPRVQCRKKIAQRAYAIALTSQSRTAHPTQSVSYVMYNTKHTIYVTYIMYKTKHTIHKCTTQSIQYVAYVMYSTKHTIHNIQHKAYHHPVDVDHTVHVQLLKAVQTTDVASRCVASAP